MIQHSLFLAVLTSALTIVTASPSPAQVTTGTNVGTVSDSNGVVPGANVTIREVNKGTSDTFITDGTGTYTAPFLTPGPMRSKSTCRASRNGSEKALSSK
jgi:hypothetical protein